MTPITNVRPQPVGKNGTFINPIVKDIDFAHPTRSAIAFSFPFPLPKMLEYRFSIHIYAKIDISGRSIRTEKLGFEG
ncbi:MAG: hypothetical protein F6K14_24340 [Symploca sp. SIO2C1]|nr:hypothetical protein [Symploca sp. SIO2C1]